MMLTGVCDKICRGQFWPFGPAPSAADDQRPDLSRNINFGHQHPRMSTPKVANITMSPISF